MYEEILFREHKQSDRRAHMPMKERAAQFSPFAALTGYDEAVKERARQTVKKKELSEGKIQEINQKLTELARRIDEHPEVVFEVFIPDLKKDGGSYVKIVGCVCRLDSVHRRIELEDGQSIAVQDLAGLDSSIFEY